MSLAAKLLSASGGAVDKLYSDDVFSSFVYTGNGATQTITNGIDLAGKGGMVWTKQRSSTFGHSLIDSARGITKNLGSNVTDAEYTNADRITAFSSTGFSIGASAYHNSNAATYVSHTFRRAPKFFDVVTYTGNGSISRSIAHSLDISPGMVIVKCTSTGGYNGWKVWHRSTTNSGLLNSTNAFETGGGGTSQARYQGYISGVGTTTFTVDAYIGLDRDAVNKSGDTYVAYLFAHDTDVDGIVQCGSFTTDGSGNATVNLGWEPQYILVKPSTAATFMDWLIVDNSRDFSSASGNRNSLKANTAVAEAIYSNGAFTPSATGFSHGVGGSNFNTTYIYLAIRRPNKPPTVGTQVYNAIARTGNSTVTPLNTVGFAPDLVIDAGRSSGYWHAYWDRLRGANKALTASSTDAETALTASLNSFNMQGVTLGADANQWINHSGVPYINHFFKRAPGVFDVVCYTGTNVARTEAHNLGAAPELWIVKARNFGTDWIVGCTALAANESMCLNDTTAKTVSPEYWNNTRPTSANFSLSTQARVNGGYNYVAYLFATKAGISKVGSYTGNGSSQTIDAGFTTGARFVMIKRTDSTGDWYVWDTVRGLVAGNDPHLSLNTTAAEVTTNDSLDPANAGFIVNQLAATNINVTSATYIYLSFA